MRFATVSLLALATDLVIGSNATCPSDLTVKTPEGIYTGLIDPRYPKTRQFRAIPFAKPPVSSRRWLAPQRNSPSSEHHYATRFPASCAQFVSSVVNLYSLPLSNGNLSYNGNQSNTSGLVGEATSEDCLYLAIWTPIQAPTPPAAGLPVLFFMTGGGNILGGVDIPWQYPPSWVERTQSHIVVTINYRLGIFGFPNARGLAGTQQNLGILDQRAALEWVRDNIAAFGGDPKRIMMWGQSAGAVDADAHAYAYYKDPIVQSFYFQSGQILDYTPIQDPSHTNFTFVAKQVGCDVPCGDDIGLAELDCMRQVPFALLVNFIGQRADNGTLPILNFNLSPDDEVMFYNYTARSEAGQIADLPSIISTCANEYSTLVTWPAQNLTEGPYQPPITARDIKVMCDQYNSTVYRNRLGSGAPVFRYQYAGTYPNMNVYKWIGAYHASDLPMIFGTYHDLDIIAPTTSFEIEVSQSMQDHVLAFAQDPYHGPQKIGWNPLVVTDPEGGDIILFGADGKAVQYINGDEINGICEGKNVTYNPFP